jgi:hypothetical protein
MRDGPKGRSPLRHAQPSWGGRKALAKVDVRATPLPTIGIACPGIRRDRRAVATCMIKMSREFLLGHPPCRNGHILSVKIVSTGA